MLKLVIFSSVLLSYVVAKNALEHISIESRRYVKTCTDGAIACPASSVCITFEEICDGKSDCPADWDELLCESGRNCRAKSCSYKCELINGNATCQCPLGYELEDERVCFDIDECITVPKHCDHNCHNTEGSFICSCREGYTLEANGYTCADNDECIQHENGCSHVCHNLPGSFNCSCQEGYRLLDDEKTCKAARGAEGRLVYTSKSRIYGVQSHTGKEYTLRHSESYSSSPWYDQKNSLLFWLESYFDGGAVVRSTSKSTLGKSGGKNTIVQQLKCPEDMSVDSLNSMLYIVDQCIPAILACDLNGGSCSEIVTKEIDDPVSILVDSFSGWMFWIDWNFNFGIQRAGMDGSRRASLVTTNLYKPNYLALDHATNSLYWSDFKVIESLDLNLMQRKKVVESQANHFLPRSVIVFEDDLFFSLNTFIMTCKKISCHFNEYTTVMLNASKVITGMFLYHPLLVPIGNNPCENSPCSHLCLIAPNKTFACSCPEGLVIETNRNHTCIVPPSECLSPKFRCKKSGKCIFESDLCNGVDDCDDSEDENLPRCSDVVLNEVTTTTETPETQIPANEEYSSPKSRKSVTKQLKRIGEVLENLDNQQKSILKALAKAGIDIENDS